MNYFKLFRILLAILVAPIVPGLIFAIHDLFNTSPVGGAWYFTFSALLGYPATLLLVLPSYWWLSRNRALTLPLFLWLGMILGALVYFLFFFIGLIGADFEKVQMGFRSSMGFMLVSSLCGMMVTGCFWIIARPDKK
ncbi:hypothetical protein H8L32_16565 [Undibacterium sp. CY18W]|uniref:Uncharacterized protein n=1 Tax=Undibacterium hunanense TaxID=2762292 RepID=A0ABR6ZTA3_9BURK|nr:hypothetical protein [Undibacterium hunanense]MBC3919106.1 hypothetical protein [Undibacterium hunanense]